MRRRVTGVPQFVVENVGGSPALTPNSVDDLRRVVPLLIADAYPLGVPPGTGG